MGFGLSLGIALSDSIVANTLVALSCGFISNNLQYYLPKKERYWYILFLSLGLSILITIACKGILVPLLDGPHGDPHYATFFSRSWAVRFDIIFLQVGCMTILSVLWYSSEEEQRQMQRRSDAERLAKEAELFKLRQQLAPHFLFNSLNSISALITSHPEQARKMIQQLSDFLRGNVRKEEQQSVLLAEELQYLQLYLEIEKVRFGHRLSTDIHHDEASLNMTLPPMLLQPIVENAIKFGLYGTTGEVLISLQAKVTDNFLVVSIENPYDPDMQTPKGTGFGLKSVRRRLYLLFGRNDLIEINQKADSFCVIFRVPGEEKTVL